MLTADVVKNRAAILEAVDDASEAAEVNIQSSPSDPDPLWPQDDSPVAILPKGDEVAGRLPIWEREAWVAAGKPRTVPRGSWGWDETVRKEFWSAFEDPVHGDGSAVGTLPTFPEAADGMTISFWFKGHQNSKLWAPDMELVREGLPGLADLQASFAFQLDWVTLLMNVNPGASDQDQNYNWAYMTYFNSDTQRVDESFLLAAYTQPEQPMVWRHLVFQYRALDKKMAFFLDGNVAVNFDEGEKSYPESFFQSTYTVSELFNNATVEAHSWREGGDYEGVPGKFAQLRFYPTLLTEQEIGALNRHSLWRGSTMNIKQCVDPSTDKSYFDEPRLDEKVMTKTCPLHNRTGE